MSHGSEGRDGESEGRVRGWTYLIWPLLMAAIMVGLLQPRLVLTDTTPALGDFAGHVFPFSELVNRATRGQGILGWSGGWFGGFPLFYFYFPLPGLMVVALAPLLGFNVALKLVGITGLVALPFAACFLARSMGVGRGAAGIAGAAAGSLALMTSYELFGGNALSTLNGEFAYSLGLSFSLLYLGCALRVSRRGGRWWIGASLLMAATATSHLIPTLAALAATVPLLVGGGGRRRLLAGLGLGFLVSGFWSVPFLAYRAEMTTLPWDFGRSLAEVVPKELAWLLLPAAIGVAAVARQRWSIGPVATFMALGLLAYLLPEGPFMRARLLPYWFLGVHLLAGLGLAAVAAWWLQSRSPVALILMAVALGCFSLQNLLRDPAPIVRWAVQNHGGMEAKDAWPDYQALLDYLDALPAGRIHWEDTDVISRFGSPYAMTALPRWSPDHPVVGGLWAESSRVTPFYLRLRGETSSRVHTRAYLELPAVRMDLARARDHMQVLGARYLLAFTEGVIEAARSEPGFNEVGSGDSWTLFDAGAVPLVGVAPGSVAPVSPDAFERAALSWWEEGAGRTWPVEADPVRWEETVTSAGAAASGSAATNAASAPDRAEVQAPPSVTVIAATDGRLSFRTTAVGEAHLVRIPYFPSWQVTGALGPFRAGPSLMLVVPTTTNVQLTFRPGIAERLGAAASLLGLLWAASAWLRATRSIAAVPAGAQG